MSYNLTNLSLRELLALRKSTNYIPITGVDAIFIGTLQVKLNQKIEEVEKLKEEEKSQIPLPPAK